VRVLSAYPPSGLAARAPRNAGGWGRYESWKGTSPDGHAGARVGWGRQGGEQAGQQAADRAGREEEGGDAAGHDGVGDRRARAGEESGRCEQRQNQLCRAHLSEHVERREKHRERTQGHVDRPRAAVPLAQADLDRRSLRECVRDRRA